MSSFNKVILMGNLTRDPEVRVTPQGLSVCKFSVATNRQVKAADGTTREETVFVDVEAFGKQADIIGKYFFKGRQIFLEGRLRLDQWETQSGEKRSRLLVALEGFQFIGTRTDDDNGQQMQEMGGARKDIPSELVEDLSRNKAGKGKRAAADVSVDEDVPF
jgi:single-strand DNA-binding protein